ncbi:glucose-6-phosphate isomerase, partial [Candidatus Riflebacteria bacterium]
HRGVQVANESFANKDASSNAALLFSAVNYLLYAKGYNLSVLMPYHKGLTSLSDWYCQLWAESLGKEKNLNNEKIELGTQPIRAVGPQDQHSMLQLFIEGKRDKLFTFVRVNEFASKLDIGKPVEHLGALDYLSGKSFEMLINAEQSCTEMALTRQGRPVLRVDLAKLDAENLAALMQTLMLSTAVCGHLFNINPFDQPGVELGKQFTYGLMEKPGFEDKKEEVKNFFQGSSTHVFPL